MKKEFLELYPVCKEKKSLVEVQVYLLIFPVATIFAKGYTVIQKRRIKRNEQIMRKIILASASPRRRELLAAAGVSFKVCLSRKRRRTYYRNRSGRGGKRAVLSESFFGGLSGGGKRNRDPGRRYRGGF